jgi:hypothetical protein
MPFAPGQFISNINAHDGLARPNRFEVVIPIPQGIGEAKTPFLGQLVDAIRDPVSAVKAFFFNSQSDTGKEELQNNVKQTDVTRWLAFQCEQAELPGKSIMTIDQKIYGPSYKIPYKQQYNDISLNFLVTNEFFERKLFEMWLNSMVSWETNNARFAKGKDGFMTDITIIQYDDSIKRIYSVKLLDAFPIGIAPMQLSWSQDGFHTMSINFAYTRYEILYDSAYNLEDAASAIFGAAGAKLFSKATKGISNTISNPINKIIGSSAGQKLGRLIF